MEERIERNMAMAAKIEEQRKLDFYAKQAHHEELRAEHAVAQERDRELAARQLDLMEQRRLMVRHAGTPLRPCWQAVSRHPPTGRPPAADAASLLLLLLLLMMMMLLLLLPLFH